MSSSSPPLHPESLELTLLGWVLVPIESPTDPVQTIFLIEEDLVRFFNASQNNLKSFAL